jgi:hypothetical protein
MLEEEMEWPIPLLFEDSAQKAQDSIDDEASSEDQIEAHARHAQDASAIAVQKVFGVKIRNVLSEDKQISYRLGQHSAYQ